MRTNIVVWWVLVGFFGLLSAVYTVWNLLDPKYREAHPLTDLELSRYKQIQVSGYHDLGSQVLPDSARREVEIGVVNRNTMAERSMRYTEEWRYDPQAKTWWVTSGLPDFWAGE